MSGHVKLSPRQTIATCTAERKGKAFYGYNLNSESSVISIWRFAAADLRNALFSSIANTYAVATFYDAEHAKVAKLLINGVHHVTEDGYCVPDIVNIGVGGKSTTSERLYESYADGVEGKGILTGDNELPPEIKFDIDLDETDAEAYVKAGLEKVARFNKYLPIGISFNDKVPPTNC